MPEIQPGTTSDKSREGGAGGGGGRRRPRSTSSRRPAGKDLDAEIADALTEFVLKEADDIRPHAVKRGSRVGAAATQQDLPSYKASLGTPERSGSWRKAVDDEAELESELNNMAIIAAARAHLDREEALTQSFGEACITFERSKHRVAGKLSRLSKLEAILHRENGFVA